MRLPVRVGVVSGAAVLVAIVLGACSSPLPGTPASSPAGSSPAGAPSDPASAGSGSAGAPSEVASSPVESSRSAGVPSDPASAGSGSAGAPSEVASSPVESSGSEQAGTQPSGAGLAVADLDYNWTGVPVSGSSTVLPDGEYRCFVSNAPADASLTWIGNLVASGANLELNGSPGSIEYTATSDVHISGAGLDSAQRTVVVQEIDGTVALWVRFPKQTARCAP